MNRMLLLFLFLSVNSVVFAQVADKRADSLLIVLDKEVEKRAIYTENRIAFIDDLAGQIREPLEPEKIFAIYARMFDGYKNFQIDSALCVAGKRYELALKTNNEEERVFAEMNKAEVLIVTGMFKDAMQMLEEIKLPPGNANVKSYFNHLHHSLYVLLSDYSFTEEVRAYYKEKVMQYKDSILSLLPPDDFGYKMVYDSKLIEEGRCKDAVISASKHFEEYSEQSHTIGLTAYSLSAAYRCIGNTEMEKKYLTISAISDLRAGVKEYISLRELAMLLYKEGDVKRAYLYSKCAMEDAMFCHARLRAMEISNMLPIINSAYDQIIKQEKRNLHIYLITVSILVAILLAALIYIKRQLHYLAKHRRLLKEMNDNLTRMLDDLDKANLELKESNFVKEEYIGSVFNICSAYIGKLEEFRIVVNRKLKVGQYVDLIKLTGSSTYVNDELKEFYKYFDSIFLKLYPNFVSDFNTLLHDDSHIFPKEGELLSPELRIYALVRMGISDSVKIAEFLHYSPQTVYNYRMRIRNKARIPKEGFSAAVKGLGKLLD